MNPNRPTDPMSVIIIYLLSFICYLLTIILKSSFHPDIDCWAMFILSVQVRQHYNKNS